jgi:hypothetical protein
MIARVESAASADLLRSGRMSASGVVGSKEEPREGRLVQPKGPQVGSETTQSLEMVEKQSHLVSAIEPGVRSPTR